MKKVKQKSGQKAARSTHQMISTKHKEFCRAVMGVVEDQVEKVLKLWNEQRVYLKDFQKNFTMYDKETQGKTGCIIDRNLAYKIKTYFLQLLSPKFSMFHYVSQLEPILHCC